MPNRLNAFIPYVLLFAAVSLVGQSVETFPYKDPNLPPEQRAADLVSRMTLEEKVLQMQNSAPAIPRLGIPVYDWWNEALHGVARAGLATVFPQAIGLAASWDTEMMFGVADVISTEARAKYHEAIRQNDHGRYRGLTFWSPNINIFRDPRWGRGQETYGEDPYLTARLAVAFIKGMQGDHPRYYKTIATSKHYAVHSGPEPERHRFNAAPSERDLRDTYLPAFRATVVEAKVASLMCAYNAVNGVPACASTDLLQKTLYDDWGFRGFIVSDCGAIRDIFRDHQYKPNAAEASAIAVKAGTDLTCGNEYRSLVEAVNNGLITEAEIDRSLQRLYVGRFKLGMFDPDELVPYAKIPYSENDSAAHRQLALEAARKSIVLLKNENRTLPLPASVRRIAVVGPAADDEEALLGNYNGIPSKRVPPLEGIRTRFAGKADVRYALGSSYVEGFHTPVDSGVLTPPSGEGNGLLAEYFSDPSFDGQPTVTRVEPRPDLQPGGSDQSLPQSAFSVRWTGSLRVPAAGEYILGVRGGGFGRVVMRVFLDDQEVIGNDAPRGLGRVREGRVYLEAGKSYALRVEYSQPGAGGSLQLTWVPPAEPLLADAVAAVKASDVAIAFVGLSPSLEGEEMPVNVAGFRGGDRTDITLPAPQQRLLEAAMATGKPLVVVLTSGSAVALDSAAERVPAVLAAWYGGQEIGTAIAETLAGANNPAGRLPVTFYRSVDQLPPFDDYSMSNRTYRYFHGEPLYGFGFGLSYSRFEYSRLRVQQTAEDARVSVRVRNAAGPAGDEVVQLYVSGQAGPENAVRELRGFRRIHLRAGETQDVEFTIPSEDLPQAGVTISVGGGQPVGGIPHVEWPR